MLTVRVGATFDLHRRTSGLVGLGHLTEERRRDYWKQSGEPAHQIKAWEAKVTAIRQRGFALEDSPLAFGVKDCAVPILGSGATLLGVLCVSHIRRNDEPGQRPDIARTVVGCARAISAEFGPTFVGNDEGSKQPE